jgi:hypothetical protein
MNETPDFRELVGDGEDLTPEERDRLERVHDLLVAAGPPPELPPALIEPTAEVEDPVVLPRRRIGAVLALAAALALAAFLGGYLAGRHKGENFTTAKAVSMHGVGVARAASATIDIGSLDSAGNWPLQVKVQHLPAAPKNAYYEMFLTQHGKIAATCGTFVVKGPDTTTVRLNAPYNLSGFDGWVVTLERPGSSAHPVVLTT